MQNRDFTHYSRIKPVIATLRNWIAMAEAQDTSWMRGVSLAGEAGGPDVNVHSYVLQLRRSLERYCNGPYSNEVKGFALVLRIDGSVKKYGAEGVDRIRRRKREEYITADICIPERRWKGASAKEFSRYLSSAVKSALRTCVAYLKKQKVDVDEHRLLLDYGEAEAEFLGSYQ
jgi:hypothetical protein